MSSRRPPIVVRNGRSAFTLVELLVVVAIISLLLSILLPALNRARDLATAAVCSSNLNQLFKAQLFYASDYNDSVVPDAYDHFDDGTTNDWYPSWPGADLGLGAYVPFKEAEEGMRSADVFRCPTFVAEVKPRPRAPNDTDRRRNDFTYSLNWWTAGGHRHSAVPPFNYVMDPNKHMYLVSEGFRGPDLDYAPPAKMGKFPRPAVTVWAMDGAANWSDYFAESGWSIAQIAGPAWGKNAEWDMNHTVNGKGLNGHGDEEGVSGNPPYIFQKRNDPAGGPAGNEYGTQPWDGHAGGAEYVFLDGHVAYHQEDLPVSNAAEASYFGGGDSGQYWSLEHHW